MRRFPLALATAATALALAAPASAQKPPASASAATEADSLARFIPQDGLVVYLEFQGTDAHAAAWKKTAAAKILETTATGAMLDDLATQVFNIQLDRAAAAKAAAAPPAAEAPKAGATPKAAAAPKAANPNAKAPPAPLTGAEISAMLRHALRSGFVFGMVVKEGAPKPAATLAVRKAMTGEAKAAFEHLIQVQAASGGKAQPQAVDKPGGRKVSALAKTDGTGSDFWWVENKEDFVITDDADAVIGALQDPAKGASAAPSRAALLKAEAGAEALGLAWLDVEALGAAMPMTGPMLEQAQVKGLKRVEFRVSARGEAIQDDLYLVAPSPRSGALALFDQPKMDPKALPPLPTGVVQFAAFTADPAKTFTKALDLAKAVRPDVEDQVQAFEDNLKTKSKLRLREDILARLGPRMAVYASPAPAKGAAAAKPGGLFGGLGAGGFQVPKAAILVEIKDTKSATNMIDQLMFFANKEMKAKFAPPAPPAEGEGGTRSRPGTAKSATPAAAVPEFKVMINNPKTYSLKLPTQYAAMTNLQLTLAIGKKFIAIGTAADATKEALAGETKPGKGLAAESARAIEGLPPGVTFLAVTDPRDTLPDALAGLPASINALLAAPTLAPPAEATPAAAPAAPAPEADGGGRRRGGRPGAGGGGGSASFAVAGGPAGTTSSGAGAAPKAATPAPDAAAGDPAAPGAAATVTVDPSKIPDPKAVRALLFPGASVVAVDDRAIHFLSRQAFPDLAGALAGAARGRAMQAGGMPMGIPGVGGATSPPAATPPGPARGASGGRTVD